LLLSAFLAGCGSKPTVQPSQKPEATQSTETKEPEQSQAPEETAKQDENTAGEYKQSPYLDGQNLPPVKDRLPKEPKIVNEMPEEILDYEIGTYGGTLRTVTSNVEWDPTVWAMNNEPLINTPGIYGAEVTGNVVKGFEVSADEKEFTFFMREGLKWSDGEPVTSEDVAFTMNDFWFNEEITPTFPQWLRSGGTADGTPVKFDVIDDYTFKLSFDKPYGGLLLRLAIKGWVGYTDLLKPKHYLSKFHVKYADKDELESLIAEAGYEPGEWVNLFNSKDITNWAVNQKRSIGFPSLCPWLLSSVDGQISTYKRNPYYFKVDSAGNQLPYIDEIKSELVQDMEVITMKMLAGEVDYDGFQGALKNLPLYKENGDKNGFKIVMSDWHVTPADFYLNLNYDDPVWQQVTGDIRFRKAINYALNRDEFIDAVYYGFGEPSTIIDSTFNLDEANKLLDEMGMKMESDGYRIGPDGKRFTIPIEFAERAPDMAPVAELIAAMLKEVGLHVTVKTIDLVLWEQRNAANELKATVIWTEIIWYNLGKWAIDCWGNQWYRWWLTGGKHGVEPPENAKDLFRKLDAVFVAKPEDAIVLFEDVKENLKENVWWFQYLSKVKQPLIVNKNLGNVEGKKDAWGIGVTFSGETFFFRK
jgi:peptide/nickel transport system substrate-binding protein